jgi:hypothetical protein
MRGIVRSKMRRQLAPRRFRVQLHGHPVRSIVSSILGILVSGTVGGLAGWSATTLLGFNGVGGALVAAAIGMVVATAVWIGLTVLLRALGFLR